MTTSGDAGALPDQPATATASPSRRRLAAVVVLGWLATLGVDLFFNAGVFAGVFFEPSSFLLPPAELFRRIPLGYLSFLVMTAFLVWLLVALDVAGWRAGARVGLLVGVVVHGAGALALASVSTARPSLLAAWFVGQAVQTVVAGAVVGHGLDETGLRRLAAGVVALVAVLFAVTVGLQSLGLVTSPG